MLVYIEKLARLMLKIAKNKNGTAKNNNCISKIKLNIPLKYKLPPKEKDQ